MLPMQRITRLPLLVDAILSQMDSTENSLERQMCELTLASLNSVSSTCFVFHYVFSISTRMFSPPRVYRSYKTATKALEN